MLVCSSHHKFFDSPDEPKSLSDATNQICPLSVDDLHGWDGRSRTYDTRYQKALPYHLATSQRSASITLTA